MPVQRISKAKCRSRFTPPGTSNRRNRNPSSDPPADRVSNLPRHSAAILDLDAYRQIDIIPQPQTDHRIADTASETFVQHDLSVPAIVPNDTDSDENICSGLQDRELPRGKLELLDLDERNEHEVYDEVPPTCIHYSIEWKVLLNNKLMSKDTEPNLVLTPRFYWSLFLRPKLEKFLQKKVPHRRVACDDTSVVVSVTGRSERDLTKRFDELDIDWFLIERQLSTWSELFRAGKKLRIDIAFNYVEVGEQAPTKKVGKRGFSSTTQQMLAERDLQVEC